MNREKIIQMAREHDLNCYGSLTENSLYTEILCDFVAAIRAATKEEDAVICEKERVEESTLGEISDAQFNLALEFAAAAIRASK